MKTVKEVRSFVEKSLRLPQEVPDFAKGQGAIRDNTRSRRAEAMLTFFKPVLDAVDFTKGAEGMSQVHAKHFEMTAKLGACIAIANHLRGGTAALQAEATTAGVDLPTFTRQLLLTVTRAYAQLFAIQLFGVLPLSGPTGRLHFKDYKYDSNFNGSTPYIAAGNRTDDLTVLNPDYYAAPEGTQANKVKYGYTNMDIGVTDYRVVAEWSDQFADDAQAVYGDDAETSHMNHMSQEMARVVDRKMVAAMIAAVPAANQYSWTAQPAATPNYATLSPSEKQAYDELLYRDAINTTISKIRVTRKYNNDGDPRWAICGTSFALRLNKLTFFQPVDNVTELDLQTGALRDLGTVKGSGIRYLVDPMLASTVSGGADMCFFGRKPMNRGDVGVYWCPYIALQPTRDLYDPDLGMLTKAVRSRFGIAKPNTGQNAASSQLGEIYGQLTVA